MGAEETQGGPVDAVILASGRNTIPLFEGYEPGYKALIPFEGRPSFRYVLDAVCGAGTVGRVCLVGPKEALETELAAAGTDYPANITVIEGGESFLESLSIGLGQFRDSPRPVLFATADAPLLTPGAVRAFLDACAAEATAAPSPYPHSVYVSAVPRTAYKGPYRKFTKPFNRFRDVAVCHGNLFLLDPGLLKDRALWARVNRMYAHRKNLRSVLAIGWKAALAYLLGAEILRLLTLRQVADVVARDLKIGVYPVLVHDPHVSMDVDEPDDYEFVRDRLREAAAAARPGSDTRAAARSAAPTAAGAL
jgi:Uncharacterized MobA-related protein